MSKFTIKVELQGLKIEVEGTKEDAPKLAQRIGQQFSAILQPAALLEAGNGNRPTLEGEATETDTKRKKAKKSGGGGTKTATDDINFIHDSAKYGTPQQGWTQTEKAIWFLYIVAGQANVSQQTAYSIMKNFNKYFKAAGQINNGNVMKGLDKEKLKGANATVGTDVTDGTAKYFLTQSGTATAQRLAQGRESAAAAAAGE
jgi:hypothetical protein